MCDCTFSCLETLTLIALLLSRVFVTPAADVRTAHPYPSSFFSLSFYSIGKQKSKKTRGWLLLCFPPRLKLNCCYLLHRLNTPIPSQRTDKAFPTCQWSTVRLVPVQRALQKLPNRSLTHLFGSCRRCIFRLVVVVVLVVVFCFKNR